ncbi:MAG: ATPase, partial [Desulfuromonadales bacterium]|nr:ATPase [Desulfuromonadales bacterium]NIS39796.1 ATPase [Desulfuromonadales bacterium]
MNALLGEKLVNEKMVSEDDLQKALERQRLHGGRIGYNLAVLGAIEKDELNDYFRRHPRVPETIADTGLNQSILEDLVMRHVSSIGHFRLA